MATPNARSGPDSQSSVLLALPGDALYEILLRFRAKDLCRLRAVCRPWRHLLSDPHFIAAHAGRHPEPLIVAGYKTYHREGGIICDILDLSGHLVNRISSKGEERVRSANLGFICTSNGSGYRLLNLATGAVHALPKALSEEHAAREEAGTCRFHAKPAFGQVASTGEYKVLRVIDRLSCDYPEQIFEVFTLDSGVNARWRAVKAAPYNVTFIFRKTVVINGIVYFFYNEFLHEQDHIGSFDLETEEWRPGLTGPLIGGFVMDELSLAAMNGCLVVVHRCYSSNLDLWFLMDFERGLWVKQHSIQVELGVHQRAMCSVGPLLELNDGRIVIAYQGRDRGSLRIYNPRTNTSTADVAEAEHYFALGLYTGSPLSLANCAS